MDQKLIIEKLQIILKTAWGLMFELDSAHPIPHLIWDADEITRNAKSFDGYGKVIDLKDFRNVNSEANCIFEFSAEEVSKMPKQLRDFFRYGGKNHRIRKKENGVYEIRFMYKGIVISASSKNLEQAKKKIYRKVSCSFKRQYRAYGAQENGKRIFVVLARKCKETSHSRGNDAGLRNLASGSYLTGLWGAEPCVD